LKIPGGCNVTRRKLPLTASSSSGYGNGKGCSLPRDIGVNVGWFTCVGVTKLLTLAVILIVVVDENIDFWAPLKMNTTYKV
jgi:hypothetical protein